MINNTNTYMHTYPNPNPHHSMTINSKSPKVESLLTTSDISSILPIDLSTNHILLCPQCHFCIPKITKITNDPNTTITFNCLCSSSPIETSLTDYFNFLSKEALIDTKPQSQSQSLRNCKEHSNAYNTTYCTECNEWLCDLCLKTHNLQFKYHYLTNRELRIYHYCPIHNDKRMTHYCIKCSIETCNTCLNDYHSNHRVSKVSDYLIDNLPKIQFQSEADLLSQFNIKITYYAHIKEKKIEDIKAMIRQLTMIMHQIEEDYKQSLLKNIHMLGLIEIAYSQIFNEAKVIPNVNAMSNLLYFNNAFEVNSIDILSAYDNIRKSFEDNIVKLSKEASAVYQKDLRFDYNQQHQYQYQHNQQQCDAKLDKEPLTLVGHTDWVKCLVQLSENQLASCSYDKTIRMWNLTQEKCVRILKGHKDWIRKVIYLDKNIIASCSDDTTIKVWNVSLDEHIVSVQAHHKAVYDIIKLKRYHPIPNANNNANASVNATITSRSDSLNNDTLNVNGNGNGNGTMMYIVASSSEDLTIKIWNVMRKELLMSFEGHCGIVSTLNQLSDGRIVSGSYDKTIRIWNVNRTQSESLLNGHLKYIHCVIELDGDTNNESIASCGEDKLIKIWTIKNSQSQCINTLIGHSDGVLHLIKLHDSRIASCSIDKTIKFWNVAKDTPIASISIHNYAVRCIIQLKNGKIASCSDDLTVKVL